MNTISGLLIQCTSKIFIQGDSVNPFAPELPVTARADPRPFYPL